MWVDFYFFTAQLYREYILYSVPRFPPFDTTFCKISLKKEDYKFNYSNFGFAVLGLVLENVYKCDYVTLLNDYKTNLEMMYLRFNEIPHYENTISIKKTTLTSKTIIDYDNINLNELVKVDSSFNEVIKNNKVSITKLKKQYDLTGAYCKYKN